MPNNNPLVVKIRINPQTPSSKDAQQEERKPSFRQYLCALPFARKGEIVGVITGIMLLQIFKDQGCVITSIPGLPDMNFPGSAVFQYILVCGTSINYMHNLGAFFDAIRRPCAIKTFKERFRCLATLVSIVAFPIYIFSVLSKIDKFMGVTNCTQSPLISIMIMFFLLGQISNISSYCGTAFDTLVEIAYKGYQSTGLKPLEKLDSPMTSIKHCCNKTLISLFFWRGKEYVAETIDLDGKQTKTYTISNVL